MSTSGTTRAGALRLDLRARDLAMIGVSVVAGLAIWRVGVPARVSLFDTPTPVLSAAVALLVALTGISVAGALHSRAAWRVVDIVVASVLGVAGGVFFWGLGTAWTPLTAALKLAPPSIALLGGLWLLPGVLGGLIIRKPGAAVYTELVGAVLEALMGDQFGFSSVYYGLLQGLGAEFVLALFFYRSFGLVTAMLAGVGAGAAEGLLDITVAYPQLPAVIRSGYVLLAMVSGAVIAGGGAWALTRALARTGALAPLASGRAAERV
jgi:energy-coupling factor transport system substrate-specific component